MKRIIVLIILLSLVSCTSNLEEKSSQNNFNKSTNKPKTTNNKSESIANTKSSEIEKEIQKDLSAYKGNANVISFEPVIKEKNLYPQGDRVASLAEIDFGDGKAFDIPASINYKNEDIPFARDLYNPDGTMYEKSEVADISYENKDAFIIDEDGEVFTAYIFANNYFEIYVNGQLIAKDKIPYIAYNSSIVKFKAKRPFHLAFRAVDWEEDLGFGREANKGLKYAASEGGIVFTIKKGLYEIIDVSDSSYKVQTFYTAPIEDLSKFKEISDFRDSSGIAPSDLSDEKTGYGLLWDMPEDVFSPQFDDSSWQLASEYNTDLLTVDELPAYSNFRDIFDSSPLDAKFIWTANLYLDNDIVIRGLVE